MDNRRIVDILNDLLAMETGSYAARLRDAGHYVSWPAAGKMGALRAIVEEDAGHERWLTEEIRRLSGSPRPRALGIRTAGDHYVDAQHLLPKIVADERGLVAAYRRAQGLIPAGAWITVRLLTGISARHEAHLNKLGEGAAPPA